MYSIKRQNEMENKINRTVYSNQPIYLYNSQYILLIIVQLQVFGIITVNSIQLLTIIKSGVLALVGCTVFTAAFSICVNRLCLHRAIGSFRSVPMQNLALCLSKSAVEWNAILQFRQLNSPKPSISLANTLQELATFSLFKLDPNS